MQITSVAAAIVLLAGVVYFIGRESSRASRSSATTAPSPSAVGPHLAAANAGVSAHVIKVGFPVANLQSLATSLGFAGDIEFDEQDKAIRLFVDQINEAGGIHGRRIDPVIANFDPTNEADMRALCKQWTEGAGAVFAVLDGVGTYSGDDELCITQEGHTPMISQWTTVTNWTQEGAPNLWWTGPDDAQILQATVDWGLRAGLLGDGVKVAVIAGDRASDQLALDDYLLPDLARAGVQPMIRTIAANPSESATTESEAPLVVQQLEAAGVTSVIPLLPFNVFFPILLAETTQSYFPHLLLS
ncbi:MAG TPA: ABC transporter substrate-binding protein, partial [Acidimicrobiales bacterium]|nr:ABC transporter substrate-binding protein [Acidimicrobiales bacterium]